MEALIIGRLMAGLCTICVLGTADHTRIITEPTISWKQHISSRLASAPLLKDDVLWIPLVKGGVEARSTEDGRRLFRLKTRKEVRLFALSGDSLCAARFGDDGRVWLLANDPPRLMREIEMPSRLLDIDVGGSDIAVLMGGPVLSEIRAGTLQSLTPLQLAGTGWSDIHITKNVDGKFAVLIGRREGSIAILSHNGSVERMFRIDGGIYSVESCGGYVIVGRNGMLARMNSEMEPVWTRDLAFSLQTDPVLFAGELWIPLRNRTIVRLCSKTGNVITSYDLAGPLACPMAPVGTGMAYSAVDSIITIVNRTGLEDSTRLKIEDRIAGIASDQGFLYVTTERGDLICCVLD